MSEEKQKSVKAKTNIKYKAKIAISYFPADGTIFILENNNWTILSLHNFPLKFSISKDTEYKLVELLEKCFFSVL